MLVFGSWRTYRSAIRVGKARQTRGNTYVGAFWSPLSFLPIVFIQDDFGPAAAVDGVVGDSVEVVLGRGGGTNVGLGVSMSDMRTSSDEVGGTNALVGVGGPSGERAREARLCIRQFRLPAREREGAVTTTIVSSSPSEACALSWVEEDMELVERCCFTRALEGLWCSRGGWLRGFGLEVSWSSSWMTPPRSLKPAAIIRTPSLSPSRATPPRLGVRGEFGRGS